MPALTIKNVPQELYETLKHSAATHHRSINSELISCLEAMLMPRRITSSERVARARALRHGIQNNVVSTADIEDAIAQGRP
jgi:plasmid stability protein